VTPSFPFSAVLGQERLKLALLLCAIDPAVGGVLVQGPRGVAKTTLARAFAELLPGRFVELPLGATEERVAGSLDLGKALGQGEVHFSPGLLARAHDGVLYVDEVNLLPDALVDLLLDAAATGTNVVERDGVSHVHAARFVLVGTMNPEEGELRPQLSDRFGLSVTADPLLTPAQRTEVVLRRLAFEADPAAFVARHGGEQHALVERCRSARGRAAAMPFSGAGVARAAELCHQARVEGVRADLAMLRAARAHAAWHERSEITAADVDAVAEFALAHRRRTAGSAGSGGDAPRGPAPSGPASRGAGPLAGGAPGDGRANGRADGSSPEPADEQGAGAAPDRAEPPTPPEERGVSRVNCPSPAGLRDSGGYSGAMLAVPVRPLSAGVLPAALLAARPRRRSTLAGQRRRRGSGAIGAGSIDWVATLAQLLPTSDATSVARPGHIELRRRPRRLARPALWVIAVDCSASMLRSGALGRAKGIALELLRQAPRASARVELVAFGGSGVAVAASASRGSGRVDAAITSLGAGGGTPLAHAVRRALELCATRALEAASAGQRVFLLTDGRVNLTAALPRVPANIEVVVVDLELGPVRMGRAPAIASALSALYVHADALGSQTPPQAGKPGT
jgi:Mg-chelatase subunit ChlI/Mg-chelatase subunit ChlD